MSLFSSIGKVLGNIAKPVLNVGKNLLGGAVSAVTNVLSGGVQQPVVVNTPAPMSVPPIRQNLTLPTANSPISTQVGSMMTNMALNAAGIRTGGRGRMKVGRLSGNAIPAGYYEKMSAQGVIYLAKGGRRRGLSARDLSAYRRVDRLLHRVSHHPPRRRKG